MKYAMRDFSDAIEGLFRHQQSKSVTVFCNPIKNPTHKVRATYRRHPSLKNKQEEIIVTFGKLNYVEREWQKKGNWVKGAGRRIVCWTWPKRK